MGADLFTVYSPGPNPTKAFEAAVETAKHNSGHGGYTGTIAEKTGWHKVQDAPLPLDAARTLADALMSGEGDLTDKWGPANAVPVAPDTAFRTKHRTLYLSLKDEGYIEPVKLAQERLRSATIAGVEVLEDKRRTKVEQHRAKKRVTEWVVVDRYGGEKARESTVTKACAVAKKLATSGKDTPGAPRQTEFHVRGVIEGEGSPHYAVYRQKQISRKVKLKVTYVEQTRKDPAPIGWLFFGNASS